MTTQTYPAELYTSARRLRWLRRNPNHSYKVTGWGDDYNEGMAHGYEYALRILLDEFHIPQSDNAWFELMYGKEADD